MHKCPVMHAQTIGAHTVNDYVESIFGGFDHVTQTYRYIAVYRECSRCHAADADA